MSFEEIIEVTSESDALETSLNNLAISDQRCAICLSSLDQKTELDSCTHSFCYMCIQTWSKSRRICPLCNSEFTTWKLYLDKEGTFQREEVPIPEPRKSDIASDLECLDQNYFNVEAMRLLVIAREAQRNIVRSQKQNAHTTFGNKFSSSWEAKNFGSLASIVLRLENLVQLFRSDQHIEPHSVLQDLYEIETQMDLIWRAPLKNLEQQVIPSKVQSRYSADDYYDLSSDSEDEYCYEFDGKSNPKKERKESGRAPKRPTPQKKNK